MGHPGWIPPESRQFGHSEKTLRAELAGAETLKTPRLGSSSCSIGHNFACLNRQFKTLDGSGLPGLPSPGSTSFRPDSSSVYTETRCLFQHQVDTTKTEGDFNGRDKITSSVSPALIVLQQPP
ncbi:unnamed protein product [Protopolystoma xenopodis]|uniref:Uncharacterized protein n=1 Tax=Protopolystoma xenopodis TaxID=117903 RepID=A0A448WD99_9PLAT|nr:unnamed protein product [Protopolystoma xenopodis]